MVKNKKNLIRSNLSQKQKSGGSSPLIWSIDASASDLSLQAKMLPLLEALQRDPKLWIEPVYVVSKQRRNLANHYARHINGWIKSTGLVRMSPLLVLSSPQESVRRYVSVLLSHAKNRKAIAIATSTHARKGVDRLFFGSFAETLILKSDHPLLIVNPFFSPTEKLSRILYPTDLLGKGKKPFLFLLKLASRYQAKLTILHVSRFLFEHAEASFGPAKSFSDSEKRQNQIEKRALNEMVRAARARNVDAEAVLLNPTQGGVVQSILDFSEKNPPDLIAMVSRKDAYDSFFLGSVTRQVVRKSSRPVWVMHSL